MVTYKYTLLMAVLAACAVIGLACVLGYVSSDVRAGDEFGLSSETKDVGLPKSDGLRLESTGLPPSTDKFQRYEKVGMPPPPATLDKEPVKGLPQTPQNQKTFKTYPKVLR